MCSFTDVVRDLDLTKIEGAPGENNGESDEVE
jgi:hypothetical protein